MKKLFRSAKNQFKNLQDGKLRWLVACAGTIQQTIKHQSLVLIHIDDEGDWHNNRSDAILVSPELNVSSLKMIESTVRDVWCHRYDIKLGDTVVDIGAGIGDEAIVFSHLVGHSGVVIALEAHPGTYRCLLKTIKLNELTNIMPVNVAASDCSGEVAISDEANFLSNNILSSVGVRRVKAETFDVICSRLGIRCIDLMKINIEGAEVSAISGMHKALGITKNIVVECHDFKTDRGESENFRTYSRVREILLLHGFQLTERKNDERPAVRYTLYGEKKVTSNCGLGKL